MWFGHGCSGDRMIWKRKRCYGLGMDALVTVCSGNTKVFMAWAGCSGDCMLWEHERYYGFGMDGLVTVCTQKTNVTTVWAWML